jgi:hypothetical protein
VKWARPGELEADGAENKAYRMIDAPECIRCCRFLIAECGFRMVDRSTTKVSVLPILLQSETRIPRSAIASAPRGAALVDELDDADSDGAEQQDVDEPFLAQHEFSHEPRGEERRGEQTDVQVTPNPFA